jgi:hypothetical protein
MLIAGIALAPPGNAETVLWIGGTGGSLAKRLPSNLYGTTADLLNGAYQNCPLTTISYPSSLWPITGLTDPSLGRSVKDGVSQLKTIAKTTEGPLVIMGTSQGALVVQQAEAALNDDPSVPSSTTFILIADPNYGFARGLVGRYIPILDYTPVAIPETRFNTIIVANQYDLIGQPITRPWNLLTQLNALMAFAYVHPFAQNTDLSAVPPENITTTTNSQNGTTTIYVVPTKHLPLTMPLRQLGIPNSIVDRIDAGLRPIIDEGYAVTPPRPRGLAGLRTARSSRPVAPHVASRRRAAAASTKSVRAPAPCAGCRVADHANRAGNRAHSPGA